MADTVELDPGSGGAIVSTEEVTTLNGGGAAAQHVQRMLLAFRTGDGVAVDLPGDAANGLDVDVTRVQGTVTVTGALTDTQLRATPVPISGTVTASGPVTDTQLRATAVPVSLATLPALVAGAAAIGKLAANSGVDIGDVDVTSISAGTNAIGNVGIVPRTSGGLSAVVNVDIDESEDAVKASAGQVFGWYLYNDGAAEVYVKLYNDTVANVTVGTTAPLVTLPIPAGAAANVFTDIGIPFSAAITIAATTGAATADTGAPATGQVVGTIFYL